MLYFCFPGSIAAGISSSVKGYKKGQPSKLVIFGIIFGIISFAVAFVGVCVLIRVYRPSGKHKTIDS
jgi:t-SNARE complex subunit (syntaxin)